MSSTEESFRELIEEHRKTNELLSKKLKEPNAYLQLKLKRDAIVRDEPTSKSDRLGIVNKVIEVYLIENGKRWNQIIYYGSNEEELLMGWVYKGNLERIRIN